MHVMYISRSNIICYLLKASRIPTSLPVGQRVPLGSGNHDAVQKIILYVLVNAMTFGGVTGEELKWVLAIGGSIIESVHSLSVLYNKLCIQ